MINQGPKIVIHCSNKTQLINVSETITLFQNGNYKMNFRIFVDEADKTLSFFEPYYNKWCKTPNVKNITLVTATPSKILQMYKNINILKINSHDENLYHWFLDCEFVLLQTEDLDYSHLLYKKYILQYLNYKGDLLKGDFYFIPASKEIHTHTKIKNIMFENNFDAVIIINGNRIQFYNSKNLCCKIETEKSLSQIIEEIFQEYSLHDKLVGLTGHICINRGITINSEKVQITHVIAQEVLNNSDDEYKQYGRICGNIKKFSNYRITKIYCGEHFKNNIIKKEKSIMKISTDNCKEINDQNKKKIYVDEIVLKSQKKYRNL